jgi:vitamin B12 transporter
MKRIAGWVLLSIAAAMAAAEPPVMRQEIVVTADRAPSPRDEVTSATAVLDEASIERTPATSSAGLLALVPGIVVFGGEGTVPAAIAMRGFYGGGEVEYARLLIDGVPAGDVESGLAQWQAVPAEQIERIEVARGVASPLYGDGAFGGVVQLFTRRREAGGWNATAAAGSSGSLDGTAALWTKQLSLLADASASDGDRPHDARRRSGVRVMWTRDLADSLLTLAAEERRSDREEAGPLPLAQFGDGIANPVYRLDYDDAVRRHAAAALHAPRWSASLHAAARDGDGVRSFLLVPPAIADRSRRDVDSRDLGAALQVWRSIGGIELRAGFDGSLQDFSADYFDVASGNRLATADLEREVLAAYVTAETHLSPRVTLTAGARGDRVRDRGGDDSQESSSLSPRLALHVAAGPPSRPFAVYIAAGGGFKAPTLEQLFDTRPLRLFGSSFVLANAGLVPQRARTIEAGIARNERFGRWQADAYLTRVTNEIDFDPLTFRYANLRRSEHRGLELLFEPVRPFLPRLTYTWMRVASLDDRGAQLKNIPEHSATAMLTAPLPLDIAATALYAWNGGRWLDDANSIAAPDTHTLSLRLARELGPFTIRVDALNLTDRRNVAMGFVLPDLAGALHPYAWPEAGRAWRVGVGWER